MVDLFGKSPVDEGIELAAALVEELAERLVVAATGIPTGAVSEGLRAQLEDVGEALDVLAQALEELAGDDPQKGVEQIAAVAGALDPSLLDDKDDLSETPDAEPET